MLGQVTESVKKFSTGQAWTIKCWRAKTLSEAHIRVLRASNFSGSLLLDRGRLAVLGVVLAVVFVR